MTKAIFTSLLAVAIPVALSAQTGIHSASPEESAADAVTHRQLEAARPLLGYITDSSNVLRSVVGSSASPQWGDPVLLLDPNAVAFLPPRQEYVLLASDNGLSVARLSRSTLYPGTPIPNAMPKPDRVVFSPSGGAAALLSNSESRLETLTYVAGQATILGSIPIPSSSSLTQVAISDDGELIAATFDNQPPVYSSKGSAWQTLSTNFQPAAWTFLPNSHNLVISDPARAAIAILPLSQKVPTPERILAFGNVTANAIASNKQGDRLLAVAVGTAASWSIDLIGGSVTGLPDKENIDSLTVLRDGQTFLTSTKDSPVLVRLLNNSPASTATRTSR